jgi:hypothetical protein
MDIMALRRDLVRYVWTCFTNVASHLAHNANVLIAIQQRVFLVFSSRAATMSSFVCFETCVGEDDDEPLGVLVGGGYRYVLFGDESRQFGCWERLRPCVVSECALSHTHVE